MSYLVLVVGLRANKLLFIVMFNTLESMGIVAELRHGTARSFALTVNNSGAVTLENSKLHEHYTGLNRLS